MAAALFGRGKKPRDPSCWSCTAHEGNGLMRLKDDRLISPQTQSPYQQRLPVELHYAVLAYLDGRELINAATVCYAWYLEVTSDGVWAPLLGAVNPEIIAKTDNSEGRLWYAIARASYPRMRWGACHPSLKVDEQVVACEPGVGPWKTVVGTTAFSSGIRYWEVKVKTHKAPTYIIACKIGIVGEQFFSPSNMQFECQGWIAERQISYFASQTVYMTLTSSDVVYTEGDIIGVLLHLTDERFVALYKNGRYVGKAFELPPGSYYPAVSLDFGCVVELSPLMRVLATWHPDRKLGISFSQDNPAPISEQTKSSNGAGTNGTSPSGGRKLTNMFSKLFTKRAKQTEADADADADSSDKPDKNGRLSSDDDSDDNCI